MSIQFDRQRLLENSDDRRAFAAKVKAYLMQHGGANEDAANMLAKAVEDKLIDFEKAVAIAKATTGLGEMSGAEGAGGYPASLHATKKQYMGPELEEGDNSPMFKVGDKVKYLGHPAVITKVVKDIMDRWQYNLSYNKGNGLTKVTNILNGDGEIKSVNEDAPMLAHGKADISTYTNDGFTKAKRGKGTVKGVEVKDLWGEGAIEELSEGRGYSQFKREAATRSKGQQMHEAAKMINKKLDEINKLLEYTNQMRGELSEGEEQLEYKHNTKALFEKMNKKVVEAYTKLKKVK